MVRAKVALAVTMTGALVGCGGGGGGGSDPQPTQPASSNVVGATSQAACEQAAERDASACYVVDGSVARMYGVLGSNSLQSFETLRRQHSGVTEILMVDVPGSEDDETNVRVGRALHEAGLDTRVLADSVNRFGRRGLFPRGHRAHRDRWRTDRRALVGGGRRR